MATYIAFLRAVNVGGRVVKMDALRRHLTDAGFTDVETYIQSGNVRLTSSARTTTKVERLVEEALGAAVGFEIPAMVRTPRQLADVVESAPPNPLADDARHYVAFLRKEPSDEAAAALDGWDVDGERLKVVGRDLHIWLTKPAHRAQATNTRLEKIAKIQATSRNWTVVSALAKKWGVSP